jgi:hypothetical protein
MVGVVLQQMFQNIKLRGKEAEISQIDNGISIHGDTNTLSMSNRT